MLILLVLDHYLMAPSRPQADTVPVGRAFDTTLIRALLAAALAAVLAAVVARLLWAPLRDAARAAAEAVRRCDDTVSELQQLEQNRALTMAGLAHDLRAPLTRLRARAEVMLDVQVADAFIRDADLLSHIINRFLDYSKLDPDLGPAVPVEAHCRAHWGPVEYRGTRVASIVFDFAAGDAFRLPAVDIERLLSNLIENAMTYGAGPIRIQTRRRTADASSGTGGMRQDYWELSVRDHGSGIAPAKLEAAQQPFVRLDGATGGAGHFGLGLAIVNKLVLEYRGVVVLENAPGGGLSVSMRFPM